MNKIYREWKEKGKGYLLQEAMKMVAALVVTLVYYLHPSVSTVYFHFPTTSKMMKELRRWCRCRLSMENNLWVVLFSTGMKIMTGPILVSALLLCFSFLPVFVFFVLFVFSVFLSPWSLCFFLWFSFLSTRFFASLRFSFPHVFPFSV
jgi:hypothetical protein